MRLSITFLLLISISISILCAQELRQTDYEKGYVKDGKKYSVWQYFNASKEVELSINHTTGRVIYIKPDTTKYVIFKNGEWTTSKLDICSIPTTGFHNFYKAISDTLKYPSEDYKKGLEGKVVTTFEVDTVGITSNYVIVKGIGGVCDAEVLASLKSINAKWIPARIKTKRYPAKFAISFEFRINKHQEPLDLEEFKVDPKKARLLGEFIVKNPIDNDDGKIFTFVEKSAEPVGGMEAFYKWVGRTIRYPSNAKRYGITGKVFVKFIIERDGSITNVEVSRGSGNLEINQEAVRVITIMPNWKPGEQSGKPVRQAYTLPITFKLG